MKRCHIAYAASAVAALIGAGLGAAPAAAAHQTLVVRQGESIQQAVNRAQPGDTVLVLPGTYKESVTINTPQVTLRGLGGRTVIEPAVKTVAGKAPHANTKATKSCAEGGNGICVIGTKKKNVEGVTVADLRVTGFARAGVFGMATDGMTVRGVQAVKNAVWGIAQERSVRGHIFGNYAQGNGDAGVFLANTITEEAGALDTRRTVVERNRLENNRIGVTVRRLRNLAVAENYITGNCAGVFVVGDENRPKAGALEVAYNNVSRNNKSCPKTDRLPAIQGSGIVLTGTEKTVVDGNRVVGNTGKSPLSGGIVLFKSFVGVTNDDNRISDNALDGNAPADLVNTETKGKGNTFQHNACRASKPSGLC
ncbi:Nitrous oxidase accessory protein NosD, contains tandem CASH domains [Streptomyces misionensis]|uniref:Nitrous oxidase accessory protein NosD, contains tandem CASH domains n=1 Tax=Streptomyces misionensis TaxID=67331 RepID=A0A1H4XTQ8_9ACTN|nr:right-handed parallel beta-helix repeat-containing protein [Streptomyces misionensis]SED08124.1 Nitrous oxidase accessory protein NosD, contains tandem CASH domains [Streptomyces misionensis]